MTGIAIVAIITFSVSLLCCMFYRYDDIITMITLITIIITTIIAIKKQHQ